ncbi:hypothetical protein, partial [Mesorhizobium sp.]|uniref:hypothetical protein n=1 Tax=Mesorhizobium sp. TaxID=1871066 RepID=UPI0025C51C21
MHFRRGEVFSSRPTRIFSAGSLSCAAESLILFAYAFALGAKPMNKPVTSARVPGRGRIFNSITET